MPLICIAELTGPSLVLATNPMTTADAVASINRQADRGHWSRARLVDVRGVAWLPTIDEIRRLVREIAHLNMVHGRRGSVAFVADDRDAISGMLRVYSMQAAVHDLDDMGVFNTIDDAFDWLAQHTPRVAGSEHALRGRSARGAAC